MRVPLRRRHHARHDARPGRAGATVRGRVRCRRGPDVALELGEDDFASAAAKFDAEGFKRISGFQPFEGNVQVVYFDSGLDGMPLFEVVEMKEGWAIESDKEGVYSSPADEMPASQTG